MLPHARSSGPILSALLVGLMLAPVAAKPDGDVPFFPFATPVFGLADADGRLFVADAGAGIVELRRERAR